MTPNFRDKVRAAFNANTDPAADDVPHDSHPEAAPPSITVREGPPIGNTKSPGRLAKRRGGAPSSGGSRRGPDSTILLLAILSLILNGVLLLLVVALVARVGNLDRRLAVMEAEGRTRMSEILRFTQAKYGVFTPPGKRPQSVLVVLEEDGGPYKFQERGGVIKVLETD